MKKKYTILQKIGAGGMGEVFRARNEETGGDVAIKILPASLSHNEEVKSRFLREMVTCARLNHPHIIRVHDYGHANGTLYYVMEHIPGKSVSELIEDRGALPLRLALMVTAQILEALVYIHERNLVHRDLKPSNVQVTGLEDEHERAVLMDFGLVKAFDSQLTRTGRVLGTPRYIAPEMLSTGTVDHRSDIFQLGIILYEMVVGGYAFKGQTRAEVARNALTVTPEPASLLNPDVDVNLDNIIFNAIEKDPDERYATAAEMLEDLRAYRKGKRIYRRQKRRTGEASVKVAIVEAVEADDPALEGYLDDGAGGAAAVLPRWAPWLLPLLLVPFLLVGLLGREPVYTVRGLHVDEGVDRAVVTWTSEEPYPTVLQYGQNPRSMTVVGEPDGKPVRDHRVELPGLREGASYAVQVVFPDGRTSDDHRFATLAFQLTDLAAGYNQFGRLDVSWKSNVPARGFVEAAFGERTVRADEEGFNVIHRLIVDVPDPMQDAVVRVSSRTEDGKETALDRRTVPSIFSLAQSLHQSLTAFDPSRFLAAVRLSDEARSGDRRTLTRAVDGRLRAEGFREALRSFTPVAARFFDDARVPMAWKVKLYGTIARLMDVDAGVIDLGGDPPLRAVGLLGRSFALAEETTFRGAAAVETLPVSFPPFAGLVADPGGGAAGARSDGLRESVDVPLLLLDQWRFERVEVRLALEGMTPSVRLDLSVNDAATLRVGALGRYRPDERVELAHAFPVELLREGPNEFRLTISTLTGSPTERPVRLRGVTFAYVVRERRSR